MAELLFRAWVDPGADVTVTSAGTHALVGHAIDRSSASALGQLGIDPTQHKARQFETWMARDADLILTATREHRDLVITELPALHKRTFTIKEFARMVGEVPPGDPRSVVAAAAARRGHSILDDPEDDDVRDPYKAAIKHAKTIAEEITEACYPTVAALGFAAPVWTAAKVERARGASDRPAPY
jgi:protein-tyrosine phosphatase